MNVGNWFEIPVEDMQRARAFYGRALGNELVELSSTPDGEMWAFSREQGAPNSAGALVRGEQFRIEDEGHIHDVPSRQGTRAYFQCDDVAVEQAHVAEAGGRVIVAKMSIGEWGFIAMAQDTEGDVIGLHSQK